MNANNRESGTELLRIILILMVILLHYNNRIMGGALGYAQGASHTLLLFLESISICAVNCFMIISGFFLYGAKKVKLSKVAELLFIVYTYRLLDSLATHFIQNQPFSIQSIILISIPYNYFAIYYIISYILSPYINLAIEKLNHKQCIVFSFIITSLFIVYPTITDIMYDLFGADLSSINAITIHGDFGGYNVVQFIYCLAIGMVLKKENVQIKASKLIPIYMISILIIALFCESAPSLLNYCSIFTIASAICLFLLFNKISFKSSIINYIAKSVFAVFCIHTSGFAIYLWKKYCISADHLTSNIYTTALYTAIAVFSMFLFSILIDILINRTWDKHRANLFQKLPTLIKL